MTKVFKVKSTLDEKPTVIAIYHNEYTNEIIQTYNSRAPYPEELKKALEVSKLWDLGIELNKNRKNPYKVVVETGLSGCEDYFVAYAEPIFGEEDIDAYHIKYSHALHVSMYGKLNVLTKAWLGDIVAALQELNLDTENITTRELTAARLDDLLEQGFKLPNTDIENEQE